jgi:hypothetical protein
VSCRKGANANGFGYPIAKTNPGVAARDADAHY